MAAKQEEINFEEIERNFFEEVNRFREDPQSYIPKLEAYLPILKDNILYLENQNPIITQEGTSAVEEAIEALRNTEKLPALRSSDSLNQAAKDHTRDIGPKGICSHDGSDGSNISDRVDKYCEWEGALFENLDFGSRSAHAIILSFLIDDGIKSRQHRHNLLDKNIQYFGISVGHHKEYKTLATVIFANNIRDKNTAFFDAEVEFAKQKEREENQEPPKEREIKNPYQAEDEHAPDETVSVRVTKCSKIDQNGKEIKVTKKFYTLNDGRKTIVEVEDHN